MLSLFCVSLPSGQFVFILSIKLPSVFPTVTLGFCAFDWISWTLLALLDLLAFGLLLKFLNFEFVFSKSFELHLLCLKFMFHRYPA